jgi:hypothetical protein
VLQNWLLKNQVGEQKKAYRKVSVFTFHIVRYVAQVAEVVMKEQKPAS